MTLALRVLIALVAGFLFGLAVSSNASPAAALIVSVLAPVGTIFVNLIRMTVVPLVVSLLVASVGSNASSKGLGRIGLRALFIAIGLLTVAALGSELIAERALTNMAIDRSAAQALASSATTQGGSGAAGAPSLATWLVDLVPQNAIKAAADGSMLPLIVFSVLFGLALAQVDESKRRSVLNVVEGIAEAMQRLVVRVMAFAPLGVFALAVPLASRLGWTAAGAVVAYVGLVVTLTVAAAVLLLYPLGILAGPMSASDFVSFCAPSQAIAFAARSSLAALPAMVQSAERAGLPSSSTTVALPLAAALYHFGAAVAQTVGVVFLAHLYGVSLTPLQHASIVLSVVLASFAVPGIPGGSIIAMVPVLAAANLPLDGIGILLAVDAIPDMFRTTANVTGTMTLLAILPEQRA